MKGIVYALFAVIILQVVSAIIFFFGDWIIFKGTLREHYYLLHPITDSILLILLIIFLRSRGKLNNYKQLWKKLDKRSNLLMVVLGVSFYYAIFPLHDLEYIFGLDRLTLNFEAKVFPTRYYLAQGFSRIVLVPILEELFFKVLILKELINRGSSYFLSIFVSSVLFAYLHLNLLNPLDSYLSFISSFTFGIISAVIYVRSKKVTYTIIFHAAFNLVAFLTTKVFVIEYTFWIVNQNFALEYWIFVFFSLLCFSGVYLYVISNLKRKKLK